MKLVEFNRGAGPEYGLEVEDGKVIALNVKKGDLFSGEKRPEGEEPQGGQYVVLK